MRWISTSRANVLAGSADKPEGRDIRVGWNPQESDVWASCDDPAGGTVGIKSKPDIGRSGWLKSGSAAST